MKTHPSPSAEQLARRNRQLGWALAGLALLFGLGFVLRIWLDHGKV